MLFYLVIGKSMEASVIKINLWSSDEHRRGYDMLKWFLKWWSNGKEALIHEQWAELRMWKCAPEKQELKARSWAEAPHKNVVLRSNNNNFGLGVVQTTCV